MLKISGICLFLLAFIWIPVFSQSMNGLRDLKKQILDEILDKSRYDNRIAPANKTVNGSAGPVILTTNIFLRGIEYVCTKNQEWKIQMTFRQQWNDPRLHYDNRNAKLKYINLEDLSRVWTPDTFIPNSRSTESHTDLKLNTLVRIYPDGNVLFSIRLTTTLVCSMDLLHYPFDSQTCSINFASYGFTSDEILYQWKENDPVQITKTLNLPDFALTKFNTNYCMSKTNTGEYSCMRADFTFKRLSSKYIYEWLVPTAFLTFVSFASFWMRPKKSTRVKLLVITFILLYIHIIYINSQASLTISYSTAKDCWLSTCLIFILAAFVEYGIVLIVDKSNKWRNKETKRNESGRTDPEGNAVALKLLSEEEKQTNEQCNAHCTIWEASSPKVLVQKWRGVRTSSRIDFLCLIIFPLLFIVYIITFFCTQTHRE